jgi:iron(III) transport system substrate-binding protein
MSKFFKRRRRSLTAVLVAAALALAGCSSGSSTTEAPQAPYSPGEQALYDAAKGEPPLTFYAAQIADLSQAAVDGFKTRFPGLTVNLLRLPSDQLITRYSAERSAGASPAGVVDVGTSQFFPDHKDWFEQKPDLPELANWPKDAYADGAAMVGIVPYLLGYNSDQVEDGTAPKSWTDLTNPAYKGKMGFGDPRAVPGYLALAYLLRKTYGDDYLRKLATQDLVLTPSTVPGNQDLASGKTSLLVPDVHIAVDPLVEQGAPIKLVPMSPTTGTENFVAVATGTPSPNAARLLMNYLLTKDGQAAFNGSGGSSVLGAVGRTLPIPEGYVSPPQAEANQQKAELLGLLGLNA